MLYGGNDIYTLMQVDHFREMICVDQRDDRLCRFCLVTATLTIEQYCQRKLLRKTHVEMLDAQYDTVVPLREYPVKEIKSIHLMTGSVSEKIGLELYGLSPACGVDAGLTQYVIFSPSLVRKRDNARIRATYRAGYQRNGIPADLAAACLELAYWNFNRMKAREMGMSVGREGKREDYPFEKTMPQNVAKLLEPYRRKTL